MVPRPPSQLPLLTAAQEEALEIASCAGHVDPRVSLYRARARLLHAQAVYAARLPVDAFHRLTWRRLNVLAWAHGALARARAEYRGRLQARGSGGALQVAAGTAHGDAARLRTGAADAAASPVLPYDAQLGIRLFFALLRCLSGPDCVPAERSTFIHDVAPMVFQLPMGSLADGDGDSSSGSSDVGAAAAAPVMLWRGVGGGAPARPSTILDSLRDFLFHASVAEANAASRARTTSLRRVFLKLLARVAAQARQEAQRRAAARSAKHPHSAGEQEGGAGTPKELGAATRHASGASSQGDAAAAAPGAPSPPLSIADRTKAMEALGSWVSASGHRA